MKKLSITLVVAIFLSACGMGKLEVSKAKICVEGLLTAIKTERYDDVGKYYSSAYNESENNEQRTEKLKKLKDLLGAVESYQLTDSMVKGTDGEQAIVLSYKIIRTKLTTVEKFVVVKDEGEYRIMGHNIESQNP